MKVEQLKTERLTDFITFCKKHRDKVDESFLYNEDLHSFQPDDENPTYIVTNEQGDIVATASLIIDEYFKRGKKGRFRIFYSEIEDIAYYRLLMDSILKHVEGIDYLNVYVHTDKAKMMDYFEGLHFSVEGYSYFLRREGVGSTEYTLPMDYDIRPFKVGIDEENWCNIRNVAFSKLRGSETPITPDMVTKMISDVDYIDGGLLILYHRDKAIGIVRGSDDEFEDSPAMNIGPIAILPEYQGKGLGRILLRASINFALDRHYSQTVLCVNAENEKARDLYIQEGFEQVEAVAVFRYKTVM